MGKVKGVGTYLDAVNDCVVIEVGGYKVNILSIDGLIARKPKQAGKRTCRTQRTIRAETSIFGRRLIQPLELKGRYSCDVLAALARIMCQNCP
ncbi:MAG: hypothetical protein IPP63_11340 [Chloracidobacterium sp.]|nr:hypothetical protein [Chloracidobacterium sp.]